MGRKRAHAKGQEPIGIASRVKPRINELIESSAEREQRSKAAQIAVLIERGLTVKVKDQTIADSE